MCLKYVEDTRFLEEIGRIWGDCIPAPIGLVETLLSPSKLRRKASLSRRIGNILKTMAL